ncbi:MAG: acyl-CoA dehydrogenase [Desulfocucumaceae bacterium]
MAGTFNYSNRDHKFVAKEWLDMEKVFGFDEFKDIYGLEDVDMILDQALKVAKEIIAPTNQDGDRIGAKFADGKVTTPPSFHDLYNFMQGNGYGSSIFDPEEEGKMPSVLHFLVEEFFSAANPAFMPYIGLTGGSSGLINSFGREEDKKRFLPKMYSGDWAGTMCLTEPCCGSDVGEITSRAYATDDPKVYKIKGTKCFITAGDHDLTENIIHLLLAKCEGAADGTKGISLFIVPKIWVNEDGSMGEPNDVATVAIEHKMGIRGSATAMLSFGDNGTCRGILIGSAPNEAGKAEGMAQMFQMMNGARMDTGLTALSIAQQAYFNSLQYAKERVQGKPIMNPKGGRVRIIDHEDIRRMLLFQKSIIEACRAMISKTAYYIDMSKYSSDPAERKMALRRIEVNTPLVKAYPSDMVWITTGEAIQIHGGYGFTEEYPAAQAARDCKILSLWEGTNFIQSLDLLGRKWMMEGGQVFMEWLADIEASIESNKNVDNLGREYEVMTRALAAYREIFGFVAGIFMQNLKVIPLFSTRVMHATAMLWGGSLLMEQAAIASVRMKELGEGHFDYPFYQGKVQSAKFYIRNIVPEIFKIAEVVKDCDTSAIDILEEGL